MTTPADVLRRWATDRLAAETSERLDPDLTRVEVDTPYDDATTLRLIGSRMTVGPYGSDPWEPPVVWLDLEVADDLLAELAAYDVLEADRG